MKKIIVYDFDKTLTYKDTVFDFFKYVTKKNIFYPFKIIAYFFTMVLSKFGVISNSNMKEFGVQLFLKGISTKELKQKSEEFSSKIATNDLYHEILDKKEECYILTGSFEEYVRPLFPDYVRVIGSNFDLKNGILTGLNSNVFKEQKVEALESNGIDSIDIFYTDSISDMEVAKISKKTYIVKGDNMTECQNFAEYSEYFGYQENKREEVEIGKRVRVLFARRF